MDEFRTVMIKNFLCSKHGIDEKLVNELIKEHGSEVLLDKMVKLEEKGFFNGQVQG